MQNQPWGRLILRGVSYLVHPIRFERTTFGSASQRSIQLSYGCMCGNIRTANAATYNPPLKNKRALRDSQRSYCIMFLRDWHLLFTGCGIIYTMKDAPKKTSLKPKMQKAKAKLAATYYGKPAKDMKVIAVTGTTGREAVVRFIHGILKALDPRAGMILVGDKGLAAAGLQKLLSKDWKKGANYVVVEAPVEMVAKYTFYGIPMHMVVVTDVMGGESGQAAMEERAAKKAILLEAKPEFGVLNKDDASYEHFLKHPIKTVVSYGREKEATTRIGHTKLYKKGAEVGLSCGGKSFDLATYVADEAAFSYMAAAATAGLLLGAEVEAIVDGIADWEP